MHIVMYADRPASYGGIETHMATLAKELQLLGHRASLAFPRILQDDLFADAKEHGVEVIAADRPRIEQLVAESSVDILHTHSYHASKLAYALHRRYGLRTVTTLHGPGQILPPVDEKLTAVIAVSREISESLTRRSVAHTMIENGVDLQRFSPAPPRSRRGRRMRVVYLGRVSPSKTQGVLAVEQALASRQNVDVRYVANWGPKGKERPSAAVETELREADLVFSTGRGVREAMACGAAAAVLGAFWDGLVSPETIDHLEWYNFSGRATRQPPTADRIAFTLRQLLGDPRRLAELKAFGARHASRHWDAREMAEKTLEVYQRIMLVV